MRSFLVLSSSLLCLSLLTSPVWAEDDEVVVVTATRRPTPIEALPADVVVIDADAARARGEITLDAALAQVRGLQVVRSGPIGQQSSVFSGGAESNQTLVLFDGVRLNDPAAPEGLFDAGQDTLGDASRIEVVQGPMSALYGSDALGGVVNVLPRHGGPGALNPRLEVSAGSFDTLLASAGADGTVGRLRYALNAEGYASDGYDVTPERSSTFTGEEDGAEMNTLTGVFDFAVTDAFALDLLLRRREARADYDPASFAPPTYNEQLTDDPDAEISQNDSALWRLGGTWDISDALSLRASGGAVETDRAAKDGGFVTDSFHGERRFADITADWDLGAIGLIFGATKEDEDIDALQFGSPIDASQEHWGAFAGAQATFGALDLTGALRHDDYDGFGASDTWRIGAAYHVTENARVHAAYGTSFRAPSLYERFVYFGNPLLDPEQGKSWEIGADAQFALFGQDDGLVLGALYRHTDIEDLIAFDSAFFYSNVDEVEIDFAQARAELRPLSWLTAQVSYDNTDARDAATNEALRRRPRHAWSAALEAEQGAFSGQISWRQVGARDDILYGDDGFFLGVGRAESYEVVRASAGWQASESVRLYVAADNLLDDAYEPANGFAGAPRNVLFGVHVTP
ncbi:MAG: TonB-dependent receptor [Terricaulis sp.]